MATTDVPAYDGPIPPFEPGELRDVLHDWLVSARGNEDKAGDLADATYYEGWADSCESVLRWLTGDRDPS